MLRIRGSHTGSRRARSLPRIVARRRAFEPGFARDPTALIPESSHRHERCGSRYRTDNPYEASVGYSRAVRVGQTIAVSGTTATETGGAVTGCGDAAAQARRIFDTIEGALVALGSSLADVVRLRFYVRDMDDFAAVVPVVRDRAGRYAPAMTVVEVSRFIHPDILLEIEADAVVRDRAPSEIG